MKKFFGLLICILLFLICTAAFAAGTVIPDQSGKCWEDECWWELDNGVLTIRATGDPNASSCGWDAGSVKKVVIEDGVTRIPNHAFSRHTGLTEIIIPASVTDIGTSVFSFCTGISEIHIPEGVKTIYNMTFYGCKNLKTLYADAVLHKSPEPIAFSRRKSCEANSRISTRDIDDGVTGMQLPLLLRCLYHGKCDPVLNALVRIKEFQFCQNTRFQSIFLLIPLQFQQGSMADQI